MGKLPFGWAGSADCQEVMLSCGRSLHFAWNALGVVLPEEPEEIIEVLYVTPPTVAVLIRVFVTAVLYYKGPSSNIDWLQNSGRTTEQATVMQRILHYQSLGIQYLQTLGPNMRIIYIHGSLGN